MNLELFNFFFQIGKTYPLIGTIAVFISGPLSFVVVPFGVTLYFFIISKNKMSMFAVIYLSLFSSWFFARLLKEIFRLDRPFVTHQLAPLAHTAGYSFPSEHAAVYGALSVILFSLDKPLGYAMMVFTVLVMVSRLIVGVHYPLDVLAGVCVGIVSGLFFVRLISKII